MLISLTNKATHYLVRCVKRNVSKYINIYPKSHSRESGTVNL